MPFLLAMRRMLRENIVLPILNSQPAGTCLVPTLPARYTVRFYISLASAAVA
jgi:hypothetical protein